MFGNGFGNAVKNTFQIIEFGSILNLDNNNVALFIFSFDVHTIKFIGGILLV